MRLVCHCVLFASMLGAASAGSLTVVLDFQGPRADRSVEEMKREAEAVLKPAGVTVDWRLRSELESASVDNLVVVRFKGKCVMEPVGYLYDERGPLAFTYSTSGEVQPYSEVACDRVTRSVRAAMSGGDFGHGDVLFGRALGRVVAHEMLHMLRKSGEHDHTGVYRPALSGKALIAPAAR